MEMAINKRKTNRKLLLFIGTVILILIAFILWAYKMWEFADLVYLINLTDRIRNLHFLGLLLYLLIFVLGTIAFLPSLPFALLGGITYGTLQGIVYASIGNLLGASMAFIIARYIGRSKFEEKLKASKTFHEINNGIERNGWRIMVLTRMFPIIPHWLQNYAYGLTTISFKTYALVSLFCIIPGTAAWIFAVNTGARGDIRRMLVYITIIGLLVVLSSFLVKRIYGKDSP